MARQNPQSHAPAAAAANTHATYPKPSDRDYKARMDEARPNHDGPAEPMAGKDCNK